MSVLNQKLLFQLWSYTCSLYVDPPWAELHFSDRWNNSFQDRSSTIGGCSPWYQSTWCCELSSLRDSPTVESWPPVPHYTLQNLAGKWRKGMSAKGDSAHRDLSPLKTKAMFCLKFHILFWQGGWWIDKCWKLIVSRLGMVMEGYSVWLRLVWMLMNTGFLWVNFFSVFPYMIFSGASTG